MLESFDTHRDASRSDQQISGVAGSGIGPDIWLRISLSTFDRDS